MGAASLRLQPSEGFDLPVFHARLSPGGVYQNLRPTSGNASSKSHQETRCDIDTDPLGAHLDCFGFVDNTGMGGLTGRSTAVDSDWPTKRAWNDLRFLERKI